MSTNFQMESKKSNGNLHVSMTGDFDGSSAWKLINLLHKQYEGKGQIFVNTHGLREIHPFGCGVFKSHFNQGRLPADRLFFKGEKGLELAPKGSRIILAPKNQECCCSGECKTCFCYREDKAEGGQPTIRRFRNGNGEQK